MPRTDPQTALPTSGCRSQRRIFLSYARADRPRVAAIADALQSAGIEVWWDALIEGGAGFAKTIAAALEASDVVLVVWSTTSVESDWVLDEAMHGRDRRCLIPVSIDGAASPLGFRQYQVIGLAAWHGDPRAPEWLRLLHAIDAIVDRPTGPQVPPPLSRIDAGRRRLVLPGLGLAVLAATGGGWWVRRRAGVLPSISNSVAVLPFRNMGDDRSQSFFSDGLSEELRTALSRVHDLQVAARTSSNVFREQQESAQSIGAKLGVAFLLEGSVRRAQDVVRIAVSLIDTATGFNRWSQSFDRTLRDIFAVQSEIADAVATTIVAQIATAQPRLGSTTNVQAFEAYLRGRALYHQDSGEETDRAALELFDEAIAADPLYAAAHAIRSRSLLAIASAYSAAAALPALHDEAEGAARRATELAPDLADGHWAMADLLFEGRLQVQAARQPYDSAHRVGAGDADFLSAFAFYCAQTGRDSDAITEIRRALVLDPLNARAYRMTGWVHYTARRYSDCIAPLRHALAMNDKLTYAYASIGDALLQLGRPQEARDAYGREPAPQPGLTGIAIAERKLGNDGAAQAALDRLIAEQGDSALYQQAQVRAQWQDTDGAIACLLHARQVGDAGLVYLHRDPFLDPVRADARFKQLERALGFV